MENLGTTHEKAARKPEVNRVKDLIKKDNLLTRDRKFQDGKESAVVRSFGMQGIETIDDLFNRTDAPGYNHDKAKETLIVMATAVYESMVESGDQKLMDAVVAGSYSVEKLLPEQWVGGDAADPENGSRFASMVTKNFIDKFGSEENKAKVFAAMETLDYLKNNPDLGTDNFWERQAVETYKAISEIIPMGRSEIEVRVKAAEYINSLVENAPEDTNPKKEENNGKKGNKETKENVPEETEDQKARRLKQEEVDNSEEGVYLRGEIKNMPKEKELQMDLARKILDILEFRQLDPWSIEGSPYKSYLDSISKDVSVNKDVKQEIETRLRLQKTMGALASAGGWLEGSSSIMEVLTRAQNECGLFTLKDLNFLLRGKGGLSKATTEAWNMFEEINIGAKQDENGIIKYGNYHQILLDILDDKTFCKKHKVDKIDGFADAGIIAPEFVDKEGMWVDAYDNYFLDANVERKKVVRAFMAEKIKKGNGNVSTYEAEKGVELAWNFMIATGENAIFNTVFAEHYDLSEFMLTKLDTLDRMSEKKQKTIGAMTCMRKITSLAPTWLRYMSDRTVFGQLKAEDIKVERLAEITKYNMDYWYCSMVTKKIFELKKVMRSEDAAAAREFTSAAMPAKLKSMGEWINKAAKFPSVILDKEDKPIYSEKVIEKNGKVKKDVAEQMRVGRKMKDGTIRYYDVDRPLTITDLAYERRSRRMRFLMVAGWAEQAISNSELSWTAGSWKTFRDILTREYAFDEDNPKDVKPFISEGDMKIIDSQIMGEILGRYPKLDELDKIRKSREKGTWTFLKARPQSFNI
jgi:hypothetical protein